MKILILYFNCADEPNLADSACDFKKEKEDGVVLWNQIKVSFLEESKTRNQMMLVFYFCFSQLEIYFQFLLDKKLWQNCAILS